MKKENKELIINGISYIIEVEMIEKVIRII